MNCPKCKRESTWALEDDDAPININGEVEAVLLFIMRCELCGAHVEVPYSIDEDIVRVKR